MIKRPHRCLTTPPSPHNIRCAIPQNPVLLRVSQLLHSNLVVDSMRVRIGFALWTTLVSRQIRFQFRHHVCVKTGEQAEYLSELTRAVWGDVVLSRRLHTARVQIFVGSRASCLEKCLALLDTGSPASLIQQRCQDKMLACGSASVDGLTQGAKTSGGGGSWQSTQN